MGLSTVYILFAVAAGLHCLHGQVVEECDDSPFYPCKILSVEELCNNSAIAVNCNRTCGLCPDIDECALDIDDCPGNTTCINTDGGFTCECKAGYQGVNGTNCTDIDECATATDLCSAVASCTNTVGSHTCQCNLGYQGNGITCTDIDECALVYDDCPGHGASCENTVGNFTCVCNPGYEGDGYECTDIDECAREIDNDCGLNADCFNIEGGFACECIGGFEGDGYTCTDIDECNLGYHICSPLASCSNSVRSYTCTCYEGYEGDGFTYCTDIDECTSFTDNCSPNAICNNNQGGFTCDCSPGFEGDGITCTDVNECSLGTDNCDVCHATCTNTEGSFTCPCNTGYQGNGTTCTDIDECSTNTDNCDSEATCTNTEGSFTCHCNAGYEGNGTTCTSSTPQSDGCHRMTIAGLLPAAVQSDGSVLLSGTDTADLLNTRETSLMMMKNSFTLYVNMKVTGSNNLQTILGSFKDPWMFLLRLQGSKLCLVLRRDFHHFSGATGADSRQDMIAELCGCSVAKNDWQQVGFTWNRSTGTASLYVNGHACASATSAYSDRDLQNNIRTSWELGYKGDTNNGRLTGSVQHVCVAKGVTVPTYCNTCGAVTDGYCMDPCSSDEGSE